MTNFRTILEETLSEAKEDYYVVVSAFSGEIWWEGYAKDEIDAVKKMDTEVGSGDCKPQYMDSVIDADADFDVFYIPPKDVQNVKKMGMKKLERYLSTKDNYRKSIKCT